MSRSDKLPLAYIISTSVACFCFFLTWNIGFDTADEGFIWYGAQQALAGSIPGLDFMAYDIGRYYFTASVMYLLGTTDIWALRVAAYLTMAFFLLLGVHLTSLNATAHTFIKVLYGILVSILLLLWVVPYYKVFDHLAAIALVCSLSYLLRQKTSEAWLLHGFVVGLVAVIGRNHGVYAVVATCIAITAMYSLQRPFASPKYLAWATLGTFAGYTPIIALMLFADGYLESILSFIVKTASSGGVTNIPKPVPWPWLVDPDYLGIVVSVIAIAKGFGFCLIIIFPTLGFLLIYLHNRRRQEVLPSTFYASVFVSVPYMHYAFSRPDEVHLSLSMIPVLIGVLCQPYFVTTRHRFGIALVLLLWSLLALGNTTHIIRKTVGIGQYENMLIGSHNIFVPSIIAKKIRFIEDQLTRLEVNDNFLAIPNLVSLHAIHQSHIAIKEIYPLPHRSRSEQSQLKEIDRIKLANPRMVILSNHSMQDIESSRYSEIAPLIYSWIIENYELIEVNRDIYIFETNTIAN